MNKNKKVIQRYSENDLIGVIYDHFESIQSPEGSLFKSYQVSNDTMMLNISNQTFIITVMEKEKLS
jgi:hypothetical protein